MCKQGIPTTEKGGSYKELNSSGQVHICDPIFGSSPPQLDSYLVQRDNVRCSDNNPDSWPFSQTPTGSITIFFFFEKSFERCCQHLGFFACHQPSDPKQQHAAQEHLAHQLATFHQQQEYCSHRKLGQGCLWLLQHCKLQCEFSSETTVSTGRRNHFLIKY
jgi:hypothetical protein